MKNASKMFSVHSRRAERFGFTVLKKCVLVFCTVIAVLFGLTACASEENDDDSSIPTSVSEFLPTQKELEENDDVSSLPTPISESIPTQKKLDVENVDISDELPTGSSLACASIILRYNGMDAKIFGLYDLMEISGNKNISPDEAFLGDPESSGYGCYSPVVEKTINRYFTENDITDYRVVDLSGKSVYELYGEIANDNPIIVWAVYGMRDDPGSIEIQLDDGGTCEWILGTYCTLLIGYDTETDKVTFSDPLEGYVTYPREDFEAAYDKVGRQALTVTKISDTESSE